MAILDGSYPALIGGVTQQQRGSSLPNQVLEQVNMVSDPVTGPRRRPGFRQDILNGYDVGVDAKVFPVVCYNGATALFVVRKNSNYLRIYNASTGAMVSAWSHAYFNVSDLSNICFTTVRGTVFVCNKTVYPSLSTYSGAASTWGDGQGGYIWIKLGAFSKKFMLSYNYNGMAYSEYYATDDGTNSDSNTTAAPDNIAKTLANLVNAGTSSSGITAYVVDGVCFLKASAAVDLKLFTSVGDTYGVCSGRCHVSSTDMLPPSMPEAADGFCLSVGTDSSSLTYYYWNYSKSQWIECAKQGRYTGFSGMPHVFTPSSATSIAFDHSAANWPAALAGDANTNPYSAFTDAVGITGMCSFQGRLVLLSGSYVCLSDATTPTLFMRSTVSDVIDSDACEVASGNIVDAIFNHGVAYNRDLVLFASNQIAVVPGSSIITPKTAQVVPSNAATVKMTAAPVQAGNMLLFPTPGSDSGSAYSGFSGLLPSNYTTSQYAIQAATDHIPRYLLATPMWIVSSGNSGFVATVYSEDRYSIYIYQYIWKDQSLVMSAWHRWEISEDLGAIHGMWMVGDRLYIMVCNTLNQERWCSISLTQFNPEGVQTVPFLDGYTYSLDGATIAWGTSLTEVGHSIYTPTETSGEPVTGTLTAVSTTTSTFKAAAGYPSGTVFFHGTTYKSTLTPQAPVMRTQDNRPFMLNSTYWVNLRLNMEYSGEFWAHVTYRGEDQSIEKYSPLAWDDPNAQPGVSQIAAAGPVDIQVDGELAYTTVSFYTDGTREMRIPSVEYTIKTERQHRRI